MLHMLERDADLMEIFAGGERYEMVELPDSLMETTIFVGNLCEFVTDSMLSDLFQQASTLNSLPACIVRNADCSSKKYGFVTFPNILERDAAIIRFSGVELNGRKLKIDEIRDFPNCSRVRVPEKLVLYTVGRVKKTRNGTQNALRKASTRKSCKPSHMKKMKKYRKRRRNGKNESSILSGNGRNCNKHGWKI